MKCKQIINTVGLLLVVAGCIFLYAFGLPPAVDPTGHVHIVMEQEDAAEIKKGKRYRMLGRIGIALVGIGSLFQVWATWL